MPNWQTVHQTPQTLVKPDTIKEQHPTTPMINNSFRERFALAIDNLKNLTKEYEQTIIHPFCEKYQVKLEAFDYYWCFTFVRANSEVYPDTIERELRNNYPIEFDAFFQSLPDEFWEEFAEIMEVQDFLLPDGSCMNPDFLDYYEPVGSKLKEELHIHRKKFPSEPIILNWSQEDEFVALNLEQYYQKTIQQLFDEYGPGNYTNAQYYIDGIEFTGNQKPRSGETIIARTPA